MHAPVRLSVCGSSTKPYICTSLLYFHLSTLHINSVVRDCRYMSVLAIGKKKKYCYCFRGLPQLIRLALSTHAILFVNTGHRTQGTCLMANTVYSLYTYTPAPEQGLYAGSGTRLRQKSIVNVADSSLLCQTEIASKFLLTQEGGNVMSKVKSIQSRQKGF